MEQEQQQEKQQQQQQEKQEQVQEQGDGEGGFQGAFPSLSSSSLSSSFSSSSSSLQHAWSPAEEGSAGPSPVYDIKEEVAITPPSSSSSSSSPSTLTTTSIPASLEQEDESTALTAATDTTTEATLLTDGCVLPPLLDPPNENQKVVVDARDVDGASIASVRGDEESEGLESITAYMEQSQNSQGEEGGKEWGERGAARVVGWEEEEEEAEGEAQTWEFLSRVDVEGNTSPTPMNLGGRNQNFHSSTVTPRPCSPRSLAADPRARHLLWVFFVWNFGIETNLTKHPPMPSSLPYGRHESSYEKDHLRGRHCRCHCQIDH